MRFNYPVKLEEFSDPPEIMVRFPDLPEAITGGATRQEALEQASDCLEEALAARIADRENIPHPSPARGRPTVAPGGLIAAKAALYLALCEAKVPQVELARRMKVQPTVISRLLDPKHASRQDQLDAALAALGKRLVISLEPAA